MKEESKKKNWFLKHWFVSIILGLILIGIISGIVNNINGTYTSNTNSLPENKNTIPIYQVGEAFNLGNFRYTINSVETKEDLVSVWGYKQAEGTFLIISVTMKNIGDEAEYVNDEFYLIDSQGREYEDDYELNIYLDNQLSSLDKVNPTMSKTGKLVFDVPKNLQGKIGVKENMYDSKFGAFVLW